MSKDPILYYDVPLAYAVLNKPTGMDTYSFVISMSEQLMKLFRESAEWATLHRKPPDGAHAIHRLDKPTSGCLAVGLNPSGRRRLCNALQHGVIHKTYLAVIHGKPMRASGEINAPLAETKTPLEGGGDIQRFGSILNMVNPQQLRIKFWRVMGSKALCVYRRSQGARISFACIAPILVTPSWVIPGIQRQAMTGKSYIFTHISLLCR